jgi:hypothetical protein
MYLYTGDENHSSTSEPDADFYIYDFDGLMVDYVDLTEWWSNPDNLDAGGQMNGGPITFTERNSILVLNSHASCLVQMVNPLAYLESGETSDFYVWTNGNGDYVLDHNFEETANLPWVCNDYNVGVEKYTIAADNNLWSTSGAYDAGAVSFGLLAPDGTGIGYMTFAGETGGWKEGPMVIDCGSPYDGFYEENKSNGGKQFVFDIKYSNPGLYFIGHDSIKGTITTAVDVEKDTPAAFSVAQNSPNPFNPTTTIGFSLAGAGNVSVDIFNVAGQKVDTLLDGYIEAGQHSVVWNASRFSAGVYFYTVKGDNFSKTMKMTLMK